MTGRGPRTPDPDKDDGARIAGASCSESDDDQSDWRSTHPARSWVLIRAIRAPLVRIDPRDPRPVGGFLIGAIRVP